MHLNINSIRYKISILSDIVAKKIDVLCISETKFDESFMSSNFLIPLISLLDVIALHLGVDFF